MNWQPIETAPKDGAPFIAFENGDVFIMKFDGEEIILHDSESRYHKIHMWDGEYDYEKPEPTHWIHLPQQVIP